MTALRIFVFIAFALSAARGAVREDLGEGLAYLRVTDWAADAAIVEEAIAATPALVLDLRNATGDAEAGRQLSSALVYPTTGKQVRLVLISATTSPALIAAAANPLPDVITLGPKSPAVTPDIVVSISSDDDRRAYEALDHGTPLATLINHTPDKPRYDEARLVQDHAGGSAEIDADEQPDENAASPETRDGAGENESQAEKKPEAAPPTDMVLQRAIHLHRALQALRKI